MDSPKNIDQYIINIFYLISEYEANINTSRQALIELKELNPELLYNFFDKDRKGKVGPRDLVSFFV
jgi:flagellar assembly factor FliW